jgi:hypothetical protein
MSLSSYSEMREHVSLLSSLEMGEYLSLSCSLEMRERVTPILLRDERTSVGWWQALVNMVMNLWDGVS